MSHRLISQQTLLEHEVVARLTEALRTAVGWNQHGDLSRKLSSVEYLTQSFERHVERMFELEEHDGYIDHVEQSLPQFAAQVAGFRNEHAAFRRQIAELLGQLAHSASMSSEEADLLLGRMQVLLDDIDNHNKREMNLLEEILVEHPIAEDSGR
jgi:hypothetical protein